MAFEMICGHCRGNLLVEHFGVVVACPHCGAHLQIPATAESAAPATSAAVSSPSWPPASSAPEFASMAAVTDADVSSPAAALSAPEPEPAQPTEELRVFASDSEKPPPSVEISVVSPVAICEPEDSGPDNPDTVASGGEEHFSLSTLLSASATDATAQPAHSPAAFAEAAMDSPATPLTPASDSIDVADSMNLANADASVMTEPEGSATGLSGLFGSATTTSVSEESAASVPPHPTEAAATAEPNISHHAPASSSSSEPLAADSSEPSESVKTTPTRDDHVTVSKSALLMLLSYTSAITLGFLWLLYRLMTATGDYGLESLPDPVPRKSKRAAIYDERAVMPPGHDLRIGDSQRFGNIKVTVLRVTRGPVHFRHFRDPNKSRLPTAPVLKLWLRFENVSTDQEIAPLDDQLLFARAGKNRFEYHANQFVCRADQKFKRDAKRVIAYDLVVGSEWDLADLVLDEPLQPGEAREYYIPTCENDLDALTGELLWRVHIRKGYSARGNGVTTLFEVHFHSQDIRDETA